MTTEGKGSEFELDEFEHEISSELRTSGCNPARNRPPDAESDRPDRCARSVAPPTRPTSPASAASARADPPAARHSWPPLASSGTFCLRGRNSGSQFGHRLSCDLSPSVHNKPNSCMVGHSENTLACGRRRIYSLFSLQVTVGQEVLQLLGIRPEKSAFWKVAFADQGCWIGVGNSPTHYLSRISNERASTPESGAVQRAS